MLISAEAPASESSVPVPDVSSYVIAPATNVDSVQKSVLELVVIPEVFDHA